MTQILQDIQQPVTEAPSLWAGDDLAVHRIGSDLLNLPLVHELSVASRLKCVRAHFVRGIRIAYVHREAAVPISAVTEDRRTVHNVKAKPAGLPHNRAAAAPVPSAHLVHAVASAHGDVPECGG